MRHTGFIAAIVAGGIMLSAGAVMAQGPGGMHRAPIAFETLDTDGNGEISKDEFEARRAARFAETDSDGDGKLSRDEMLAEGQKRIEARIDAMIERMDGNKDGMLAMDELPEPRKSWRADKMFDRMDRDDSGGIDKAEFEDAQARMSGHDWKHGKRGDRKN